MSTKRTVNLESENVVKDKSRVVLKALAELISTKYKVAVKTNEKDEILYKMSEVIANKGRSSSQRSIYKEVTVTHGPTLTTQKSEIIRRVRA